MIEFIPMDHFQLRHLALPYDGVMPGARHLKKQIVPQGTKVYVITCGDLMYWACYQDEEQAKKVMSNLNDSANGVARRNIPLQIMLDWNFKRTFPVRVARLPKQ